MQPMAAHGQQALHSRPGPHRVQRAIELVRPSHTHSDGEANREPSVRSRRRFRRERGPAAQSAGRHAMPSAGSEVDLVPDEMRPADLQTLMSDFGASAESLQRDAAALRAWVNAEPHLPNLTREHDLWLESYLLASKNSMEKAKVRLDNYFTNRTLLRGWFTLPPPPDDMVLVDEREFMLGGFVPKLHDGYFVMIHKVLPDWSHFDMNLHFWRTMLLTDAILTRGRKVKGLIYVIDQKHVTMSTVTTFLAAVAAFRKMMACVQEAMPIRIKAIHITNSTAPALQRMVLNAVIPLLKGKLTQRMFFHGDNKSLQEHISPGCLPEDYGGTCPTSMEIMTNNASNFIMSKKEWYLSRTWMKSDEDQRLVKKPSAFGIEGSFRKLSVD